METVILQTLLQNRRCHGPIEQWTGPKTPEALAAYADRHNQTADTDHQIVRLRLLDLPPGATRHTKHGAWPGIAFDARAGQWKQKSWA